MMFFGMTQQILIVTMDMEVLAMNHYLLFTVETMIIIANLPITIFMKKFYPTS